MKTVQAASQVAYDLIGDVHGQADKLAGLLRLMGYTPEQRGYRAPKGRKAVFLGDLIDRGPEQVRTLEITMAMVDSGDALCIMGNHEFNAISYATPDVKQPGECLRPNRLESRITHKNRSQHKAFIDQVGEGSDFHKAAIRWMRRLPVALDLGGLRAVHACWDAEALQTLESAGWVAGQGLSDELLHALHEKGSVLHAARERLTCGLEIDLPEGITLGKDGHTFTNVRIANWRHEARNIAEIALVPAGEEHVLAHLDMDIAAMLTRIEGSPVFVGHHWFTGDPAVESSKIACLDWSAGKGGKLVAYRWDGEQELSNDKLVWVA